MASAPAQRPARASKSITSVRGIPVTRPQKELLNNNSVMETFLNTLEQRGVTVEQRTLHTDNITVTAGDAETGRQCLRSVIRTETLTLDAQQEMLSALQGLFDRFPSQMAYDVDASQNKVDVAFLEEISGEVLPVLRELKTPRKLVPLPDYLASFFHRHLQKLRAKLYSQLDGADIGLDVHKDSEGKQFVQFRCEPDRVPAVHNVLENMLSVLWLARIDVSCGLGLFLTSSVGQKVIQDIEDKSGCTVNVESSGELVLFTARSPQGHRVMVCEGNMAASDCDVLVLPLAEGQQEWPPSYKCVLERGCLPAGVRMHTSRVGLPPKPQIVALQCQWLTPGQRVVIMYIPAHDNAQLEQLVTQAVKEALRVTNDRKIGLGLPFMLGEGIPLGVSWRLLLRAVVDSCDDTLAPVKFYGDVLPEFQEMTQFFEANGWTCEMNAEDDHYMDRIQVTIGDIFDAQKIQADALVNSTDPQLQLALGQVSSAVAKKAGDALVQHCQQQYPKGFNENAVVVTDSYNLTQFTYIFHVALPTTEWSKGDEADLLENLGSRVEACLLVASIKGLKTIVFPALGTGTLHYPPDKEAKTVLRAARQFFARVPHSSLQLVTFVSYEKNLDVAKAFKAEETVYRYAAFRPPTSVEECRYTVNKRQVQAVTGDALSQQCTAGLLVCADKPEQGSQEDYRRMAAKGCNMQTVKVATKLANTIKDIIQNSTASSVQINLQTFDTSHVDDIITGAEKGLYSARNAHIVILIAPTSEILSQIFDKSSRYRDGKPTKTVPANGSEGATVGICGRRQGVKNTAAEVKKIDVPDNFKEAETYNLHPRFLSPQGMPSPPGGQAPPGTDAGAGAGAGAGASQRDNERVTVDVPPDMEEARLFYIFKALRAGNLPVSMSFTAGGLAEIRTDMGNLPHANRVIRETLGMPAAGLRTAPVHAARSPQPHPVPPSAGSFRVPSAILSSPATSSPGFDKNVTHQADDSRVLDPHPGSGFSMLDKPSDAGGALSQAVAPPYSGQQKLDDPTGDTSFVVLSGASASKDQRAVRIGDLPEHVKLRKEVIQLTSEQFSRLGLSPAEDCRAKGIHADIKLLRDENKVVIEAVDYKELEKATHLVKIKSQMVLKRSRSKAKDD